MWKSSITHCLLILAVGFSFHTARAETSDNLPDQMFEAAEKNDTAAMTRILNKGFDVNASLNKSKATALHIAVSNGHLPAARLLIEKGADVNAKMTPDAQAATPLHMAVLTDNAEMVKYLVEQKADINALTTNGTAPLYFAAQKKSSSIVQFLIEKGAKLDVREKEHNTTALHRAAFDGNFEIAKLLIDAGASISAKTPEGETPFHSAVMGGNVEVVKLFLEKKAPINAVLPDGATPLYLAAEMGRLDLVKYLVSQGADLNLSDQDGITPLMMAKQKDHKEVVDALSSAGALAETFYFPECQLRVPAPKGWSAQNDTKLLRVMGEEKPRLPVGEVLVSKEKNISGKSLFNPGFKTGLVFNTNYQYITNANYPNTDAFAKDILPYKTNEFTVTDKKEYKLDSKLGKFQVVEITTRQVEKGSAIYDSPMTIAFGALTTGRGDYLFRIQSPTSEWEKNKRDLFEMVKNLAVTNSRIEGEDVVTSTQIKEK